ncbi:MAG: hypothetical protein ACKPJJ_10080 [Planctomycetaceae bacterium]
MSTRKKQRLSCRVDGQTAVVRLDDMEIWDGADLALLRDVLTRLIQQDGFRSLGVDLTTVKYIPSGFFGMLFEWYEAGLEILLLRPQDNVRQMLWFRMFFAETGFGRFVLTDADIRNNTPSEQIEYHRRAFMSALEAGDLLEDLDADADTDTDTDADTDADADAEYAVSG